MVFDWLRGNRDGKAKGMSRFPVFLAVHDQHEILPGGISVDDEIYFTFDIGTVPLRFQRQILQEAIGTRSLYRSI
jgi:hypothetical protein